MVLKIENMKLIRIYLLLAGLVFLIGNVNAQDKWSLNECINYALEHNLDQHLLSLSEKSAKIDASQAKLNFLPSISASSSADLSFGRSVDPNTNDVVNTEVFSNSHSLSSSLTLFRGFIQKNQIAYSQFKHKAAQWRTVYHEDDLAFSILTAYYDVVYFRGMVEIAREQMDLSEQILKKTETYIETGLKAQTDLAEMQSTYEKEKLNLIQSENTKEEAKLRLRQQMNLPVGELNSMQIGIEEPVVASDLSVAADSLYASFVELSPYVKIAEAEWHATEKGLDMVRGQFLPSIYFNASVNSGYYETNRDAEGNTISYADQFDNNMSQYLGASISIPIFQKNQIRNEYRQAKLAEEQARIQLDSYRQTVYYELLNNARDLKALFREYIQTGKQVEADEQAYHVAQRKYEEGIIDVIELQTVKNRLAEAKSQNLRAQLQWRIKVRIVDFYKGIRFWEGSF